MHGKDFTFILTGMKDNDTVVENYVRSHGFKEAKCVQYKLEYTPPYQNFIGVSYFERITQYRPFTDPIQKKAVAIIDLSEWIGHENEEYLEIFCKFLHDYDWSFYQYEYVFTAGDADRMKIKELYGLISEYLCEGNIVEDRTMIDEKSMITYLMSTFPVNKTLATKLSHIFVSNKIRGYVQLNMVMNDFVDRMQSAKGSLLTEKQVKGKFNALENSKLAILFEKDIRKWKEEYTEELYKEVA